MKAFQYSSGGDSGWSHRRAQARPRFCRPCSDRHQAEVQPVTLGDRALSLLGTDMLLPAIGLAGFGTVVLCNSAVELARHPARSWPLVTFAGFLLLVGWICARSAWTATAYKRVPRPTGVSQAFDFGDDDNSHATKRTYVICDPGFAAAFAQLNAA